MKFSKWTYYQLLIGFVMVALIFVVHQFMGKMTIMDSDNMSLFIIFFLIALFSWFYIITFLQIKKHPDFLKRKLWRIMPAILLVVGALSFTAFIMLHQILFEWINHWKGLMYIIFLYFFGIYFYLILSLVLKFGQNQRKALNQTYILSIISPIVIYFLFP